MMQVGPTRGRAAGCGCRPRPPSVILAMFRGPALAGGRNEAWHPRAIAATHLEVEESTNTVFAIVCIIICGVVLLIGL
jgi:hypothetical protein